MKICEDFAPIFGNEGTGCSIMSSHYLTHAFHQGIFNKNNMTIIPQPTLLI
jgi:hypothetical protein